MRFHSPRTHQSREERPKREPKMELRVLRGRRVLLFVFVQLVTVNLTLLLHGFQVTVLVCFERLYIHNSIHHHPFFIIIIIISQFPFQNVLLPSMLFLKSNSRPIVVSAFFSLQAVSLQVDTKTVCRLILVSNEMHCLCRQMDSDKPSVDDVRM